MTRPSSGGVGDVQDVARGVVAIAAAACTVKAAPPVHILRYVGMLRKHLIYRDGEGDAV